LAPPPGSKGPISLSIEYVFGQNVTEHNRLRQPPSGHPLK